jgi:PAS domain S-box-containing protein
MNPRQDIAVPLEQRIYSILVTQIYTRSTIGIVATVVNAAVFVAVLWGQVRHAKLLAWLALLLTVSLVRVLLNRKFLRALESGMDPRPWGRLLIVGLGIPGLLWGATAVFLFPFHSVAHQVFIAFVLAGMVAGAVGVFSPLLPVFLAFSIPALVPVTVRFFMIGDTLHMGMGAMTTLFGILTYTTARRINASNRELIALKETFADQLEERTAELEATNEHLRHEIEERSQVEQALADSERRLTDIIDFLPDPTWVIDMQGRVIAWNRALERITGIEKQAMIGKSDHAYAVPFYGERRPMLIDLALKRDDHWEKSYLSLETNNGVLIASESFHPAMGRKGRYYASTASRLYDAQGHVVGAIESTRDITAAKRAAQERERLIADLQEAVRKVRTLTGLLPICSSCKKIRDDKGYWNQIESYIRAHSDAEFSHGICPECSRKLYPELVDPRNER